MLENLWLRWESVIDGEHDSRVQEAELRAEVRVADRVWPSAPRAVAFLPLVFMLVCVLPWIHLVAHARMHPDLAASGLRALDLIQGADDDATGARNRTPPPLPIWAQAVALSLPSSDKSLLVALPSALFGILCGLVIFRLGAVWFSPSVGILSACLLVCNHTFLEQIHRGEPGPIVLFFTLASLWAFAEHVGRQEEVFSRWTLIGGFAMAGMLLTAGAYAFLMAVLGLAAMFFRGDDEDETWIERLRRSAVDPTTRAGVITLLLGTAIASPFLSFATWGWGPWFPWDSPNVESANALGWWDVVSDAPALVVLACFGLIQSLRDLIHRNPNAGREAMPVVWTLLAAAAFRFFAPTPAAQLVLSAPLFLLASRTILAVLDRSLSDRQVLLLAAISVSVFAVRQTMESVHGPHKLDGGTMAALKSWQPISLGVVAIAASLAALAILIRWSQGSDSRRRTLFGALVVTVVALASAPGVMLLRSRPRADDPWHVIQQRFATLVRSENPDSVIFFDADASPLPRRDDPRTVVVEFLIRTTAPEKERVFVTSRIELERKLLGFERPLVVVTQSERPLPKIYSFAHGSQTLTLTERLDAAVPTRNLSPTSLKDANRVTIYSPLGPRTGG